MAWRTGYGQRPQVDAVGATGTGGTRGEGRLLGSPRVQPPLTAVLKHAIECLPWAFSVVLAPVHRDDLPYQFS